MAEIDGKPTDEEWNKLWDDAYVNDECYLHEDMTFTVEVSPVNFVEQDLPVRWTLSIYRKCDRFLLYKYSAIIEYESYINIATNQLLYKPGVKDDGCRLLVLHVSGESIISSGGGTFSLNMYRPGYFLHVPVPGKKQIGLPKVRKLRIRRYK